jgi:hypothetical protein
MGPFFYSARCAYNFVHPIERFNFCCCFFSGLDRGTVRYSVDLEVYQELPENCEELVDFGVDPGEPVDALGHDPMAVYELDALVHNHRDLLVCHLLV